MCQSLMSVMSSYSSRRRRLVFIPAVRGNFSIPWSRPLISKVARIGSETLRHTRLQRAVIRTRSRRTSVREEDTGFGKAVLQSCIGRTFMRARVWDALRPSTRSTGWVPWRTSRFSTRVASSARSAVPSSLWRPTTTINTRSTTRRCTVAATYPSPDQGL